MSTHNVNIKFNSDVRGLVSAEREIERIKAHIASLENNKIDPAGDVARRLQIAKQALIQLEVASERFHAGQEEALMDYNRMISRVNIQEESHLRLLQQQTRELLEQRRSMRALTQEEDKRHSFQSRTKRALGQSFLEAPLYSASFAAMAGIGTAIQSAIELDKVMTRIGVVTGRSAESMKQFSDYANTAGKTLGITGKQFAEASLQFLQQGGKAADFSSSLAESSIKLANITGDSASNTSEYVTAIANSFGLLDKEGSKAGDHIADMLTSLDNASGSSANEIAQAFQRSASSFASAGFSAEEASAMIATVSEVTRQSAEMVGTGFKTMIGNLADVKAGSSEAEAITSKLQKAGKDFGMNLSIINEQTGQMKSVPEILAMVTEAYNKATTTQQKNALVEAVAGKEQRDRFIALIENQSRYNELLKEAEHSSGASDAAQARYMDSLEAKLGKVKNEWEALIMQTIDTDAFKTVLDATANILDQLGRIEKGTNGWLSLLTKVSAVATGIARMKLMSESGLASAAQAYLNKMSDNSSSESKVSFSNLGFLTSQTQDRVLQLQDEISAEQAQINIMKQDIETRKQQLQVIKNTQAELRAKTQLEIADIQALEALVVEEQQLTVQLEVQNSTLAQNTAQLQRNRGSLQNLQGIANGVAGKQTKLIGAMAGATAAMQLFNIAMADGLSTEEKAAQATTSLGMALMMIPNPWTMGIGAVAMLGGTIWSAFAGASKEAKAFQEELDKMNAAGLEAMVGDGAANIENLARIVSSTIDTSSKEYIDAANKLAGILPQLQVGTDEYGNAVLDTNDAIRNQIDLLKEQIKQQKIKNSTDASSKLKGGREKLEDKYNINKKNLSNIDAWKEAEKVARMSEKDRKKYFNDPKNKGKAIVTDKKGNIGYVGTQTFTDATTGITIAGAEDAFNDTMYSNKGDFLKQASGMNSAMNLQRSYAKTYLEGSIANLFPEDSDAITIGARKYFKDHQKEFDEFSLKDEKQRDAFIEKKSKSWKKSGAKFTEAEKVFTENMKDYDFSKIEASDDGFKKFKDDLISKMGISEDDFISLGYSDKIIAAMREDLKNIKDFTKREFRIQDIINDNIQKIQKDKNIDLGKYGKFKDSEIKKIIANAKDPANAMLEYGNILLGASSIVAMIDDALKVDGNRKQIITKAEYKQIAQALQDNKYVKNLNFDREDWKTLKSDTLKGGITAAEAKDFFKLGFNDKAVNQTVRESGNPSSTETDKKTNSEIIDNALASLEKQKTDAETVYDHENKKLSTMVEGSPEWDAQQKKVYDAKSKLKTIIENEIKAMPKSLKNTKEYKDKMKELTGALDDANDELAKMALNKKKVDFEFKNKDSVKNIEKYKDNLSKIAPQYDKSGKAIGKYSTALNTLTAEQKKYLSSLDAEIATLTKKKTLTKDEQEYLDSLKDKRDALSKEIETPEQAAKKAYDYNSSKFNAIVSTAQAAMERYGKDTSQYIKAQKDVISNQEKILKLDKERYEYLAARISKGTATQEELAEYQALGATIENITKSIMDSKLQQAADDFNRKVFGTADIEALQKKFDFIKTTVEEILDTHDKIIEKRQLELDIQKEIESSTNATYKANLKYLKDSMKAANITKQQVEAIKDKIELLKALNDTGSTQQMKLTRTASGAFRYVGAGTSAEQTAAKMQAAKDYEQKQVERYQSYGDKYSSFLQSIPSLTESLIKGGMSQSSANTQIQTYKDSLKAEFDAQKVEMKKGIMISELTAKGSYDLASKLTTGAISYDSAFKMLDSKTQASIQGSIAANEQATSAYDLIDSNKDLKSSIDSLTSKIGSIIGSGANINLSGNGSASGASNPEADKEAAIKEQQRIYAEAQAAFNIAESNYVNTQSAIRNGAQGLFGVREAYASEMKKYRSQMDTAHAAAEAIRNSTAKYDTGGYTGDFSGGKFAILHEKELVLNKLDTSNILKAVEIARSLLSFSTFIPSQISSKNLESTNSQTITINAEFPNVSSSDEIKNAFASMSSKALQYQYRTKSY